MSSPRFGPVPFFNTRPERQVQSILRREGIAFDTHVRSLPGRPDIVVPAARVIIFVHGCFWHRHRCANGRKLPRRARRAWLATFKRRIMLDRTNLAMLKSRGWRVLVIWECELNSRPHLITQELLNSVHSSVAPHGLPPHVAPHPPTAESSMKSASPTQRQPLSLWLLYFLLTIVAVGAGVIATSRAAVLGAAEARAAAVEEQSKRAAEELGKTLVEIRTSKENLASLQTELAPLQSQFATASAGIIKAREDLASARESARLAETRRDEAAKSLKELEARLNELRSQVELAKSEETSARKTAEQSKLQAQAETSAAQSAQRDATEARSEATKAKADLREVENQRRTTQQQTLANSAELAQLQGELAKAKSTVAETAALESSVRVLTSRQSELRGAVEDAEKQRSQASSELNKVSALLLDKRAEFASAELQRQSDVAGLTALAGR